MSRRLGKYQRVWHLEVRSRRPRTKWDWQWQATGANWGHTRTELLKEAKELNANPQRSNLIYRVRRYQAVQP
jgi:hypothetical protein